MFQRTANFSLPAFNRPIDQQLVASIKADYPAIRQADRMSGFGVAVGTPTRSALEVSEAERQAAYRAGWERGNLTGVLLDLHRPAHQRGRERDRRGVRPRHDPARWSATRPDAEVLCPRGYAFGTKRLCLDTGYYDTFNRDQRERG